MRSGMMINRISLNILLIFYDKVSRVVAL